MSIAGKLLDVLFPPRCEVCGSFLGIGAEREGLRKAFCDACMQLFVSIETPICPVCGLPFDSQGPDHYCETCLRRPPAYDCIRALYRYEGPVSAAVHAYKFGRTVRLAGTLGRAMGRHAAGWLGDGPDYLAVPVPLHPSRLRQRGFNQSALLARHVARAASMDLDLYTFRRVRDTPAQSRLGKRDRRRNVRGAFSIADPARFDGKTVVLVDDVATTGSTLHECAVVLKRAGADAVVCLVFARTGVGLARSGQQ
ncbi:MAG TPA: ComF family protein [Desulfobacteraceae bacterium]|nr:ComF family protein [Desulfobacteraceae bacterium]